MINREDVEKIKDTTKEFFEKSAFDVDIKVSDSEETIAVDITTDSPQILIGEGGQTLSEIQFILKAVLKRKVLEPFYLNLDVNGYKKKKSEYLKEVANSIADEVLFSKKEKTLSPMPPYERRVIHLELQKRDDVATESVGEGPERRVIVKPK